MTALSSQLKGKSTYKLFRSKFEYLYIVLASVFDNAGRPVV